MNQRNVKIIGAGSIGNHLAHASRRCGWNVHVVDRDPEALSRMEQQIYPDRYGTWDSEIQLFESRNAPAHSYDIIFIGTPPDTHVGLALEALNEKPGALQIEKPVCTPDLIDAQRLFSTSQDQGIPCFVGYDHVVSDAIEEMERIIREGSLGEIRTIDVSWREEWTGIFNAHPWLSGPADSYLGFWRRGGGAGGEHSHGLNLWQHLAQVSESGRVDEVAARISYSRVDGCDFDECSALNLVTEGGLHGRVVQDVWTSPARKEATVVGSKGMAIWRHGYGERGDEVDLHFHGSDVERKFFPKKRPDDFHKEVLHIDRTARSEGETPISLERGLETMLVLAAAHRSEAEKRVVSINYDRGFQTESLSTG